MTETVEAVRRHYGSTGLVERIFAALEAAGHDTSRPTVEMLNFVDQLHGGGLNSTEIQAELVGVTRQHRVLEAGCGVCGTARYLARKYGCRVEAIDLTPEYVEVAQELNRLCGMESMITVRQGSVTDLPYDDRSFDLVWCQNVSMNVENKARMFAEAHRVLAPRGRYTISHAAQGSVGEPHYPLPWAGEPSYSFLGTPEEVLDGLKQAGFRIVADKRDAGSPGGSRPRPANDLGPGVIMGPSFLECQANAIRSGKEGRLIGMMIVAERAL